MTWLATLTLALCAPANADRTVVALPTETDAYSAPVSGTVSADPWWETLEDPALTDVIREALQVNHDLAGTRQRVEAAQYAARKARAPLLPQLSYDLGAQRSPSDSLGFGSPTIELPDDLPFEITTSTPESDTMTTGSAMLTAAWQLPLFGQSVFNQRASQLDYLAARGDRDALAAFVASTTAGAAYDLVAARQRLAVVEAQREAATELLEVVTLRYERAEASGLDVLQQRQQLANINALLPTLRAVERLSALQLNLMLGRVPGASPPPVGGELPPIGALPATGAPADLLQNRADLRAASRRVDAADRRQTLAWLAALPTVGAKYQVGSKFYYYDDGFDERETLDTWTAAVSLSVPLFTGGGTYNGARAARALEAAESHALSQAAMKAMREVEAGLVQDRETRNRLDATAERLDAARAVYEEARKQYLQGLLPYLNVLSAQATLLGAELDLIQARRDLVSARIQLHNALGGPWTDGLAERSGVSR